MKNYDRWYLSLAVPMAETAGKDCFISGTIANSSRITTISGNIRAVK